MSYGLRIRNASGVQIGSDNSFSLFPIDTFVVSGTATITKNYSTAIYSGIFAISQASFANVSVSGGTVTVSATSYTKYGGGTQVNSMSGRIVVFATERVSYSGYGLVIKNPNGKLVIDSNYRPLFYYGSVTVPAAPSLSYGASAPFQGSVAVSHTGAPNHPFVMWEIPDSPRTNGSSWQQGAMLNDVQYNSSSKVTTLAFTRGPNTPSIVAHLFCEYIPSAGSHGLRVFNASGVEIFNTGAACVRSMVNPVQITSPTFSNLGVVSQRYKARFYYSTYSHAKSGKVLTSACKVFGGEFFPEEDTFYVPNYSGSSVLLYSPSSSAVEFGYAVDSCGSSGAGVYSNVTGTSIDFSGPQYATDYITSYTGTNTQRCIFINKSDLGL